MSPPHGLGRCGGSGLLPTGTHAAGLCDAAAFGVGRAGLTVGRIVNPSHGNAWRTGRERIITASSVFVAFTL